MIGNNASLTKISQLEILIDIDKEGHLLKDITRLFINAARDWDTFNQANISDFVKELKEHFGNPLTKERIGNTTLDNLGNNAWRQEAGSSIIEMLNLSEEFYHHTDFDKLLIDILSYYEKKLRNIDFIAEVHYLKPEEGGRSTTAFSGYRPLIKFSFDATMTSGEQTFLDKDSVSPGESAEAAIRILSVEHFEKTLSEGMTFELREGSRLVGTGRIIYILNDKLEKPTL